MLNLNFHLVSWIVIGLFIGLWVLSFYLRVSLWWYVGLGVAYLSMIVYGSFTISSDFFIDAICEGKPNHSRQIAITFDDGPVPAVTGPVLDLLKAYNAPATFFCIGNRIPGNESLLRRADAEGHLIGNHSFSHSYVFDFYPGAWVGKELDQTNELIAKAIGKQVNWFRPPYGITNPEIRRAVKKRKLKVIGWNVRSLDTIIRDKKRLMNRVTDNLKGGDIVLFHDAHEHMVPVLKSFLEYARENEFEIMRLDSLIGVEAYVGMGSQERGVRRQERGVREEE